MLSVTSCASQESCLPCDGAPDCWSVCNYARLSCSAEASAESLVIELGALALLADQLSFMALGTKKTLITTAQGELLLWGGIQMMDDDGSHAVEFRTSNY